MGKFNVVVLACLVLCSFACAAPVEIGGMVDEALIISPTPEAAPLVRSAAARWTAAAGLDIFVSSNGIETRMVDKVVHPFDGTELCGMTLVNFKRGAFLIEVDRSMPESFVCRSPEEVLAHELGHALCNFYGEPGMNCDVSTGLMRSGRRAPYLDNLINTESLERICSVAPCTQFNPEGEEE